MGTSIYDGVFSPINKTASRVISAGTHYDPALKERGADQREPYPTRSLKQVAPVQRHLIGATFGRMTVIGLSLQAKRWVVRCACGTYTLRRAHAITNPENGYDCCMECYHLLVQKKRDIARRTGRLTCKEAVPGETQALLTLKPQRASIAEIPYDPERLPPSQRQQSLATKNQRYRENKKQRERAEMASTKLPGKQSGSAASPVPIKRTPEQTAIELALRQAMTKPAT
jgi:hypothetical protein